VLGRPTRCETIPDLARSGLDEGLNTVEWFGRSVREGENAAFAGNSVSVGRSNSCGPPLQSTGTDYTQGQILMLSSSTTQVGVCWLV